LQDFLNLGFLELRNYFFQKKFNGIGLQVYRPGPRWRGPRLRHTRSILNIESKIDDLDFMKVKGYSSSTLGC
jgi:hypothetical protein